MRGRTVIIAGLVLAGCASRIAAQEVTTSRRIVHVKDPNAAELQQYLSAAQDAVQRKDFAAAAGAYQKYLALKPDEPTVHYDLGFADAALGRTADSRVEFQKAIALDPKMSEAYLSLGLSYVDSDPASAVAPFTKLVELQPDEAHSHFLLGLALERTGKSADAIAQYQDAVASDPKDFDAHFALGRVLLASHRPADAEAQFRAAQSIDANDAGAALGLSQSLEAQGKIADASGELAKYLAAKPDDAETRLHEAALLVKLQNYDDALAELDRAAKSSPEGATALRLRAEIYFATKKFSLAVPPLQKAIALDPNDPNLPALLGHAYFESQDYGHAADELIVALQKNPQATDVLSELTAAEYLNKNYGATLHGLELLERRQPLTAANWFIRAACYDKLGYAPQALEAYQKFLQMNTDLYSDSYFEAASRVRALSREVQQKRK